MNIDDPIQAPAEENPQEPINLDVDPKRVSLAPQIVDERAAKFHVAMGPESPGFNIIRDNITDGKEQELRQQHAVTQSIAQRNERLQKIQSVLSQNPGKTFTPDEVDWMVTQSQKPDI